MELDPFHATHIVIARYQVNVKKIAQYFMINVLAIIIW